MKFSMNDSKVINFSATISSKDREVRPLSEIAQIIKEIHSPDLESHFPYIGLEHIDQQTLSLNGAGDSSKAGSNKFKFDSGDVLFGKLRPYFRKVFRPKFSGVCSTDIWVFRAKEGVAQGYLFYLLASHEFVSLASSGSSGTRMPRADWEHLKKLNWSLPPLGEQNRIAKILGDLDEKIELNRQMNETLENMAHTIFKSWFIDFDPVRAKLSGKSIGLPKEIADLFSSRLVESELGEIPEGWEVKTIQDIAERVAMGPFGSSIKVDTFVPEGIPVISGQHLRGFMVEDSDFNYVTIEHADKLKNANVKPGDVIFTHAGNIGQVAYIPENGKFSRYVISQRQFYVRCNLSWVSPSFMVFYFKTAEGQHRLLANASSSGVPSIAQPVTYLRTIPLIIPPKAIMDVFDESLQPILRQFEAIRNESRILANLRDTLLPKLMSGEIRVTI